MFEGFANVWTPVALSAELRGDRPMAVQVAGTPIVLFRSTGGAPAALVDRCPHRGVALSLGRMSDGCLECPFHGWKLDGTGEVRHVPWNPDAKLGHLRGTALPAREIGGHLWVYTAPVEAPPFEPSVHEALLRPGVRISGSSVEWKTHWTRAMENMLDWPHLPFVHGRTIGKDMVARSGSRMDITWEERPWGAHTHIRIDGEPQPGALDFRWPNQMNLHIPVRGKLLMMVITCLPLGAERTRMIMAMARDFLTAPVLDGAFHRSNLRIASEDRAIVESSFPSEVPPAGHERSVRTDGPTLAFRKRYYAELRSSSAPEPADGAHGRSLPLAS